MKKLNLLFTALIILSFKIYSQNIHTDIPKEVDLGVNGIMISDTTNVKTILKISSKSFDELEDANSLPHLNYINNDSTELLVLVTYPGSYKYTFDEFKVLRFDHNLKERYKALLKIKKFRTYKGLSIGMSINELKNILGPNFKEQQYKNKTILKYRLSNLKKSKFLEYYNMPSYFGNYTFLDKKLIKIEFGFDYP